MWGHWRWRPGWGHFHQVTLRAIRCLFIYHRQNLSGSPTSHDAISPSLFFTSIQELFQESELK